MKRLLIIGAGGHGKVVADTAEENGCWDDIAFLDDRFPAIQKINQRPVVGSFDACSSMLDDYSTIAMGIGENSLRVELLLRLKSLGFAVPPIIHPTAFISRHAKLGEGCVVLPKAVLNANSIVGIGGIINTGAIVEHDCVLGCGVHISPGTTLSGGVRVGDFSFLGTGTLVIPMITIGCHVISGAGTVIIRDVPDNVKIVGVPGKSI